VRSLILTVISDDTAADRVPPEYGVENVIDKVEPSEMEKQCQCSPSLTVARQRIRASI
jgi:hypothetical protein